MAHRYLEIIIPTRQFILLIVVVVGLVTGAFLLGVAVRHAEPPVVSSERAAVAIPIAEGAPRLAEPWPVQPSPASISVPVVAEPSAAAQGTALTSPPAEVVGARETPVIPGPTARPTSGVAQANVPSARPTPRIVATAGPVSTPAPPLPLEATRPALQPTAPAAAPNPTHAAGPKVHPWVQVAAVSRADIAEDVGQRLVKLGFKPNQVTIVQGAKGLHHVRLGPFLDLESANRVVARLRESGFKDAFLVKE